MTYLILIIIFNIIWYHFIYYIWYYELWTGNKWNIVEGVSGGIMVSKPTRVSLSLIGGPIHMALCNILAKSFENYSNCELHS